VNVETKEQLKHTFTKQAKKKLYTNVYQEAGGNCFLEQDWKGVLMVEFMQQGTTITSEVYCEILKKNCIGPLRTKGVEC
jgi:hypothetical protein